LKYFKSYIILFKYIYAHIISSTIVIVRSMSKISLSLFIRTTNYISHSFTLEILIPNQNTITLNNEMLSDSAFKINFSSIVNKRP